MGVCLSLPIDRINIYSADSLNGVKQEPSEVNSPGMSPKIISALVFIRFIAEKKEEIDTTQFHRFLVISRDDGTMVLSTGEEVFHELFIFIKLIFL